eukprot:GFUD01014708.1.p1 GENE.GFUD01014708.1~~GFUD01014708.1.p1  ORF type:complete len:195 (+),score=2.48 GFUD01014708.1:41-625(+)
MKMLTVCALLFTVVVSVLTQRWNHLPGPAYTIQEVDFVPQIMYEPPSSVGCECLPFTLFDANNDGHCLATGKTMWCFVPPHSNCADKKPYPHGLFYSLLACSNNSEALGSAITVNTHRDYARVLVGIAVAVSGVEQGAVDTSLAVAGKETSLRDGRILGPACVACWELACAWCAGVPVADLFCCGACIAVCVFG